MNWRAVCFDWNRARAFLAVAEERTFSAAARALEASQPTIGRQIAALEGELGVALFERVGHTLELTAAGAELVEHVRAMREAATRVSSVATGQSLALDGSVCITSSELIAAHVLPPMIARIRREHPGIEIELAASNAVRDLRRREADIAVRNVKPTQPDLIARKFEDRVARAYATPACLSRIGNPRRAADFTKAELFAFDRTDLMTSYLAPRGVKLTPRNFPIVTENHLVQWALCREGVGIAFVMEEVGDREPGVVRVPGLPTIPVPIWLVAHRELATSRRIRAVFDLLAEELARGPARAPRAPRARAARRR